MDMDELKEIAHKLMIRRKAQLEREKGFIYYHGERVGKIALKLRQQILPNDSSHDEILFVACLFHDVAKGIEPHWKYGAVLVRDILKDHCTEEEIDKVAEIIYHHPLRKQREDYSDYIKIVQDADVLDHSGTIEIWMNFLHQAYTDSAIDNALEFYRNDYEAHVEKGRRLLNYEISQRIFDEKVVFVRSFIERLRIEAAGDIILPLG